MRFDKLHTKVVNKQLLTTVESSSNPELRKFFFAELTDVYWTEKELTLLLSRLADQVSSEELADSILDDLAMAFNHIDRLDDTFLLLREKSAGTHCETMAGLVSEIESIIRDGKPGVLQDALIVSVIKRIRYNQITAYGIICSFSRSLDEIEILGLMENSLDEERSAYCSLLQAAGSVLNA